MIDWVKWEVDLHDDFVHEYRAMRKDLQDELLAHIALLEQFGPLLGRPRADTLKGSRHPNKSGVSEKRFYRRLIDVADDRFDAHVGRSKRQKERGRKEGK